MTPPALNPAELRRRWSFKPGVTYLNNGSFGPCPKPVFDAQISWMSRLRAEPCEFFIRDSGRLLERARDRLGRFLGVPGSDLIFVVNATTGGNMVARSLRFLPGDVVLTTDHEYGAMLRMWEMILGEVGAKLVIRPVPFPLSDPAQVVDALTSDIPPRTKLIFLSHVTSPTALIFPVKAVCERARRAGVPVFVDGAHAPAMFPMNLADIGADYYTGNCHKWLCAPFGSGFLHVRPELQNTLRPLIISWGKMPLRDDQAGGWPGDFEWLGTRDFSPFLATETAIEFFEEIGIDRVAEYDHDLARHAREKIAGVTGIAPSCADSPALYGAMCAAVMPPGDRGALQDALWNRFGIEVPVFEWNGRRILRTSTHVYNSRQEIDELAIALRQVL